MNLFSAYGDDSLYQIEGKQISYQDNQNLIIATGDAYAKNQLGKEIYSEKIIYDKKKLTIMTFDPSTYLDSNGNRLEAEQFFYDLKLKKIKAKGNVNFFNKEGDHFKFSTFEFYENSQKGSGQNFRGKLADQSLLEGPSADIDQKKGITVVNKNKNKFYNYFTSLFKNTERNSYTSCKNFKGLDYSVKEKCPDWSITSSQTTHDKNEKMIYHEGVLVHIRNIPVFYSPYFSHPDPSVKRKRGFLPASINNIKHLGRSLVTPYFFPIGEDKDITLTPVFYLQENPIFLGEYRQQNKNSSITVDASYTQGYKKLNKKSDGKIIERTPGSRNHVFFEFLGNYNDLLFSFNDLTINIQKVSQKNYLKVHQINTNFVTQDVTSLENSMVLDSYEDNKQLSIEAHIYESLGENNPSKKYQYTLPNIAFNNFFRKFDQSISFGNDFSARNLGENINEVAQRNYISTTSDLNANLINGMGTIFSSFTQNVNIYNQNVAGAKENLNSDSYLTLALNNTYPLVKYEKKLEQSITPILFSKYTPGSMAGTSGNRRLTYNDIYSLNRSDSDTNPETGGSIGYGIEYDINKKNIENEVYTNAGISIGQVIRAKKLKEMPNNSLREKKSDFAGKSYFKFNSNEFNNAKFNIDYNYIVNNNFNTTLQHEIKTSLENDYNKLSIDYYEEEEIGSSHSVSAKYKRKIGDHFSFLIGASKNLETDFTESNSISANYNSDCLKIDFSLSKEFYEDSEVKPTNTLTLSIILKPFGSPIAPDLSSFVE